MSSHNKYTDLALANDAPEVVNAKGKNVIPPPEKEPLWKRYFDKFKDPLIYILFIALVLSVVLVGYQLLWLHSGGLDLLFEPIGILVAILLSTGIGFYVELKAEKEFEVLNTVNDSEQVKVFRKLKAAGTNVLMLRMINIPKMDVVKGDIVRVESGDAIPADGILLESNQLLVDESAFTGEPFARKNSNDNDDDNHKHKHSHAYAANVVLRGSTVIEGNGIYQVTATGFDTEEGKGAISTQKGREVRTPLNRQLDGLGKWISWLSIGLGILVLVARVVHYFYFANIDDLNIPDVEKMAYVVESVMIAVTLVVAAVPEGLPMSITMSLALSMRRLLKENNLVRRLHACETMGATTVICTDKTGTLTQNKMTVMDSLIPEGVLPLVQMNIAVNSTATLNIDNSGNLISLGNPTEGALLRWLEATNPGEDTQFRYQMMRSEVEILEQVPFSTETKCMKTKVGSGLTMTHESLTMNLIKGAPEVLLSTCSSFADGLNKELIEQTLSEYQSKARRTLAFAADDVFLGIVGIADPIREDVPEAIRICKEDAHVKVIIVTGDNPGTALEIGRQIGIIEGLMVKGEGLSAKLMFEQRGILTGGEFAAMSDAELMPLLKDYKIKIIARAKPEDKARLVRLLQRNNEVVAVTGDGTNDAPALSKAHVGLSMGDGTARAKEASDITIIDNSFASINRAILWGRSIYKNIRRFIVFQTIVNVSACFIVLFGAFVGLDAPLNVTQMLWVNLIMDTFAALALSTIPPDKNVMYEKPRSWRAHIINRKTAMYIFTYGTLFSVFLGAVWFLLVRNNTDAFLRPGEHGFFFSVFVFMQMWNLFNVRYYDTNRSIVRDMIAASKGLLNWEDVFNKTFMFIAAVIFFGQIVIVEFGKDFFGVEDLNITEWLIAFAATSPVVIIPEIVRTLRNKA